MILKISYARSVRSYMDWVVTEITASGKGGCIGVGKTAGEAVDNLMEHLVNRSHEDNCENEPRPERRPSWRQLS